jgi:hypothetical protein
MSAGGRRSFIIIPEGRDGRGWGNCVVQMRKVVNYLEPQGVVRSRFGKAHDVNPPMSRMVDHRRRPYVDALVVKGHYQEIVFEQG